VKKTSLRSAILAQLQAELARQVGAATMARDEATSEESRPENKWDTHSQEAAYLAEGQARLAAEIGQTIELYSSLALPAFHAGDAIAVGALVNVETAGKSAWFFIGPRAGGLEFTVDGRRMLVLTPSSPLGRQLLGKRVGDILPATGRGAAKSPRIAAVE
jgi:transcription elongation GreA/GreB family factor